MSEMTDDVLGKAYDARLMRRLLTYLWPYRGAVLIALVAIVAQAALNLVPPYLVLQVIDVHIPSRDLSGLAKIGLVYLATLAGTFALEFTQTWTLQLTGQRIMYDLRMQIYAHLQRLGLRFYDRHPVGRLMTRVTSDVDVLNDLFTSGVVSVFGDVFTLAGIMLVMLLLDWQAALVAFAVLPLIVIVTQWFRRNVRESYRQVRYWIARINAFLQEHITGMATVQLFRREARTFDAFDTIDRTHRDVNLQSIFYYAVFYPAIEVIGALATALLIWYGGGRVVEETLTLGALVAFIQYSQRFFRPISDLSEKFNVLQAAMASAERIFGLLDEAPEESTGPIEPAGPVEPAGPAGPRLAFEHVWFAYEGDDYVLRDVSFVVEPGQRVGIVGATGAGKTTIISLMLRFYDVSRGRITLDGVDIREIDRQVLRRHFGLVLQDVHLFSGTIESNIRLGTPAIDRDGVAAALAAVGATRFVEALPGGVAAPVAERGATLSVGQKQLLSFARALAHDPAILVLDEATSSVDTETELAIRAALRSLMRGRTTIAIAHRLSTIQDMDTILVLHKGQLREQGSHQALLGERGIYYRLVQLQYGN
ncbi:MAG: ABC transporter ATP-binding protein [Vicinamibacterales bacterium]|nr:ABC transporter ATP-binding protein [Vicinamibacterales bacterium]